MEKSLDYVLILKGCTASAMNRGPTLGWPAGCKKSRSFYFIPVFNFKAFMSLALERHSSSIGLQWGLA